MSETLTENEIETIALYQSIVNVPLDQRRLLATLRAEQEARRRAEAQRDRLAAALRHLDKAIFDAEQIIDDAENFRGIARAALREIEGGSGV